jgi:hypothetical protein
MTALDVNVGDTVERIGRNINLHVHPGDVGFVKWVGVMSAEILIPRTGSIIAVGHPLNAASWRKVNPATY